MSGLLRVDQTCTGALVSAGLPGCGCVSIPQSHGEHCDGV